MRYTTAHGIRVHNCCNGMSQDPILLLSRIYASKHTSPIKWGSALIKFVVLTHHQNV